ncbi:hypothetical protein MRX96_050984 [Rhipicephalus microplus]
MTEQRINAEAALPLPGSGAAPPSHPNDGCTDDQITGADRTRSLETKAAATEPPDTTALASDSNAVTITDTSELWFTELTFGPLYPRHWYTEFHGDRTRVVDGQSLVQKMKPVGGRGRSFQWCSLCWKQMRRHPCLYAPGIAFAIVILLFLAKIINDAFVSCA